MPIKPLRPPYSSSKADPDRTQAEINALMRKYGVEQSQWNVDLKAGIVQLRFVLEAETEGKARKIAIEVNPPTFLATRRTWVSEKGRYEKITAPNWVQTFRLLRWWLDAKLKAIAYGLVSAEHEFMADTLVKPPGYDKPITIAALIQQGRFPELTSKVE